jgi:hypoxanthine phosphoribosyltransferase
MARRKELLTWRDVEGLVDHLVPQFDTEFDAMVIITRGGIVPGGMLCEALDIQDVMTAAVDFPFEMEVQSAKLLAWPRFIQFPADEQLADREVLIVDDVWGSGRTITAVRSRILAARSRPFTSVLHFNPYRSLFSRLRPDYFAAVTDAYIIYPWEVDEGPDRVLLDEHQP